MFLHCFKMLLLCLLIFSKITMAQGPIYKQEPPLLFIQGKAAFDTEHFGEAIYHFNRLTQKYPASKEAIEALKFLGLSYIAQKLPAKAIEPLKGFINIKRELSIQSEAKLNLARAYIDSQKYHEGLLLMISLLETEGLTEPVRFSALVHKSEAQYFLKQYQASDTTLALALEPSKAYNDIYSHALYTKLRLIHARCALYRSAKTTDERQAREQLVNRFQCWSESTLIYKNILTVGLSQWTILASRDMKQTLDKFYASLENPPFPIGRRTQQELKKYREELVLVLKSDLKPKAEQTLDLIRNWVKGNEIYKDFVQLADTIHSKLKDPK